MYYVTKINGITVITNFVPDNEYFEIDKLPVMPVVEVGYTAVLKADFSTETVWYDSVKVEQSNEQLDRIEDWIKSVSNAINENTLETQYLTSLTELGL